MEREIIGRHTPYCGVAPSPLEIFYRWNIDWCLLGALGGVLLLYVIACTQATRGRPLARWRATCFVLGWLVGALALVSPLCALSVSLFSARVAEHMVLTCVSAPLIALGRPGEKLCTLLRMATRGRLGRPGYVARPLLAALAFAGALWFWHAPAPYDLTFESDAVFWTMLITLYGSALWFWSALFDRSGDRLADFVAASFLTTGQMGLLGAVLTFAARPLYSAHLATTLAWGLTPLQDQQLGAAVMWIPAGVIFAAALIFAFLDLMAREDRRRPVNGVEIVSPL